MLLDPAGMSRNEFFQARPSPWRPIAGPVEDLAPTFIRLALGRLPTSTSMKRITVPRKFRSRCISRGTYGIPSAEGAQASRIESTKRDHGTSNHVLSDTHSRNGYPRGANARNSSQARVALLVLAVLALSLINPAIRFTGGFYTGESSSIALPGERLAPAAVDCRHLWLYALRALRWQRFLPLFGSYSFVNTFTGTGDGFCRDLRSRRRESLSAHSCSPKDHLPVASMFGIFFLERFFDFAPRRPRVSEPARVFESAFRRGRRYELGERGAADGAWLSARRSQRAHRASGVLPPAPVRSGSIGASNAGRTAGGIGVGSLGDHGHK